MNPNDKCTCGSGKKQRKCCRIIIPAPPAPTKATKEDSDRRYAAIKASNSNGMMAYTALAMMAATGFAFPPSGRNDR